MTGGGHQRTNALRRGLSTAAGSSGSSMGPPGTGYSAAATSAAATGAVNSGSGSSSHAHMDMLTDDQKRMLKRKIEQLRALEQDIEQLKEESIQGAVRRLGVGGVTTVNTLAVFKQAADWRPISQQGAQKLINSTTRMSWDMIKKAVAEEEKYQSKKNWSSTKGRGNRKAPVARRLDAEVLKKFGVYPQLQFPVLATCDSCGRQVNAHFLKEHQELNCSVSTVKREDKRTAAIRAKEREREEKEARREAKRSKEAQGQAGQAGQVGQAGQDGIQQQQQQQCTAAAAASAGRKRSADEALGAGGGAVAAPPAAKPKGTKKERLRLEKEQKERERLERKQQMQEEKARKKQEKDLKRERELAKARLPVDLDKQCGVVSEPQTPPCSRSLTCKTHSMAMKRAVHGRSKLFDALLQAHLAKSRSAAAAKNAASRGAGGHGGGAAAGAVRSAMAAAAFGCAAEDLAVEEEEEELGSDEETEKVLSAVACSRGRPLAVRPTMLPRRRHHYLRVRDLFFDALKSPTTMAMAMAMNGAAEAAAAAAE